MSNVCSQTLFHLSTVEILPKPPSFPDQISFNVFKQFFDVAIGFSSPLCIMYNSIRYSRTENSDYLIVYNVHDNISTDNYSHTITLYI